MRTDLRSLFRRMLRKMNPFLIAHRARRRRDVERQIRSRVEERGASTPRVRRTDFPKSADQLRKDAVYQEWWYYSAELLPGVVTKGLYPAEVPMIPRVQMRDIDLRGMSTLDMGTMEGIIPVLMRKGGASRVLAIDAIDGNGEKMDALRHYYDVDFEFRSVGLMYELYKKLPDQSFDLINCSGLLYHVYSPLNILAGIRPLLKRNGLLIVSTPIINDQSYTMSFNNAGRIQA